ncbi:MAG: hypothetical protein ACK5WB_09620 [Phycisphaerales bacterium]|jgi:hypothetical protein|nr:hypothetical protein [Phycisphaeraceae bacterium]
MRVIAACLALAGFVVALIVGLWAENPLDVILWRAVLALIVMNVLGLIIGYLGEKTVTMAIEESRTKAERQIELMMKSSAEGPGKTGGELTPQQVL